MSGRNWPEGLMVASSEAVVEGAGDEWRSWAARISFSTRDSRSAIDRRHARRRAVRMLSIHSSTAGESPSFSRDAKQGAATMRANRDRYSAAILPCASFKSASRALIACSEHLRRRRSSSRRRGDHSRASPPAAGCAARAGPAIPAGRQVRRLSAIRARRSCAVSNMLVTRRAGDRFQGSSRHEGSRRDLQHPLSSTLSPPTHGLTSTHRLLFRRALQTVPIPTSASWTPS